MILPFDKPRDWTSFDLVNKIRRELCRNAGIKKLKVGHAGTLDPLATGLLILCVGKATKQIEGIQQMPKEYLAEITFGASTPSFDLETEIDKRYDYEHISPSLLEEKIMELKGRIEQIPPVFSAKKFNGVRAYEFAREGIQKEMKAVEVEIYDMDVLKFDLPVILLNIRCSKGTYIRSLARDLGARLGSGAHLSNLRRTAIGSYKVEQAETLENFQKKLNFP
ncbi:MAG: tRNA pseudouridine(55) synthase TruB [Bacteroidales bacterium]|nr:tRNA pseudouridine(55) synthase TruB [Bacteroidales bacterium]